VPRFQDKNIVITGCSSGIGYCVAHGLKNRGYRVIATARRQQSVEMLRDEGFDSVQLDLADSASVQRGFAAILELCNGQIYGLFNNGAFGLPGAVEDLTRDNLKTQFETNVFGWHELTRLVLPVMHRQGHGRIIQNSSVLGFVAMPFRGAYTASKYAIEGLSDTLRLELRGTGIYVSLIEPGPILSLFRKNALQALKTHIDIEHSRHREKYQSVLQRLQKEGPAVPFTLPPEAVLKRVILALESRRPKARYSVTFPTYLFAVLKRLLSTRQLDRLLAKAGSDGKR
jgi:NAD(P)-dependent dehydrogenase (short-subunit alcohol dehydrogenase family)